MIRHLVLILLIIPFFSFSQKSIIPITLKSLHTPLFSNQSQKVYYDWESKNGKCEKYFGKIKSINHVICTIEEISESDNFEKCNKTEYNFNINGYCTSKKELKYPSYPGEHFVTTKYTYEFDNKGEVIKTVVDGELPSWEKKGKKKGGIRIEIVDPVYNYDRMGNVISVFQPDLNSTNYLEYDGCNVKLYFNSKEGKRLNGSREIGLNNQIVKEVYYERKWDHKKLIFLTEENEVVFKYIFDRKGNWITRYTYVNSELKDIDNREIQYYD